MSEGFSRTLQTAADAERTCALLMRASIGKLGAGDIGRLTDLARRYADYAQALRETATDAPPADDAEQIGLMLGGAA